MSTLNWKRRFNMENQDILICDICTDPYNNQNRNPKFLTCHHTFCEFCLQHVAGNQANIDCPTCRHVTSLGENGVKGLQTNFYLIQIKETMDKIGSPKIKGCQKHSQQPMSFFCEKCSTSICRDCTVIDHKQSEGHIIKDISAAEREQRNMLLQQIQSSKSTHKMLQSKVKQLEAESQNLTTAKDQAKADIKTAFDKYHTVLDDRKVAILKQLDEMYDQRKQMVLNNQKELEEQTNTLQESLQTKDDITQKGKLLDVVTLKTKLEAMTHSLSEGVHKLNIGTNYIKFNSNAGLDILSESVSKLGSFSVTQMLPSKIEVSDNGRIPACLPAEVTLKLMDFRDNLLNGYNLTVDIVDPEHQIVGSKLIEKSEEQQFKLSFTPQMSGIHKLIAKFHGKIMTGCDTVLKVLSNNPIAVIGSEGDGNGKFNCPRAIAVDGQLNLYVVDTGNKLIQKFDANGQFAEQFSISGGSEDFSTCDLALDETNSVIVCTETLLGQNMVPSMSNTVATYKIDGSLKHRFCNKIMKCALCVATNTKGDIIVSDYLVHSLFMYDKNGSFLRRICSPSGGFNHPAFICCDNNDNIIVSDTNNDSVQVFNKEGQFKYHFGKSGSNKGQLKQPFGVATNGSEIVVVDSGNKRIQVFSKDGKFKCMIESKDNPLNQPRGIAISKDGHIFVADRNNHCIKKYKYK